MLILNEHVEKPWNTNHSLRRVIKLGSMLLTFNKEISIIGRLSPSCPLAGLYL